MMVDLQFGRSTSTKRRRATPAGASSLPASWLPCAAGGSGFTATASIWRSSIAFTVGRPGRSPAPPPPTICSPPPWWYFISDAIARLGPRRVVLVGACCLCGSVALIAFVTALWQLYAVYLLMAVGSATMHVASISNVLGLWFDRQRGLAISLALNGASSGGILVAPVLVIAIAAVGFATAMVGAAMVTAAILLPAVAVWIDRPPARVTATLGLRFCSRGGALDAASRVAQLRILERGGTVCAGADGASRFPRAPDRPAGAGARPDPGRTGGRGPDRHGGCRTRRARRIRAADRFPALDRALAVQPGRRATCDDADDRRGLAFCRLRGVRPVGRQPDLAACADHSARVRGGVVRHAGWIVDRDRPVHLRVRPRPARPRPRFDRRLHRPLALCMVLEIVAAGHGSAARGFS